MKRYLIVLFSLFSLSVTCQEWDALEDSLIAKIDSTLFYKGTEICSQETHLYYINKNYHFIYLSTDWGPTCKNTQRLILFDRRKNYLGNYYLSFNPISFAEGGIQLDGQETKIFESTSPPNIESVLGTIKFEPAQNKN